MSITKQKQIIIPLLAAILLTACRANTVTVRATATDATLSPRYTTAVYAYRDENAVDVYLTDLDPAYLNARLFPPPSTTRNPTTNPSSTPATPSDPFQPSADFLDQPTADDPSRPPVGQITHIAMFVRPYAGRTPIDPTAANAAIRHAIFAEDARGIYVGAGFVLPRTNANSNTFSATIPGATLALGKATPDFTDELGTVSLTADFHAIYDERTARTLALTIETATDTTRK